MAACKASMVSYTQAQRGQRALQRQGIVSSVQRLTHIGPEGCGYLLVAEAPCEQVQAILEQNGISSKRLQGSDRW